MHRNSYMDSPNLLEQTLPFQETTKSLLCWSDDGVEGYVESAASGLVAWELTQLVSSRKKARLFSRDDSDWKLSSLHYPCRQQTFPTNECQFGIIKELEGERIRDKKARYEKIAERALADLEEFFDCLIFF